MYKDVNNDASLIVELTPILIPLTEKPIYQAHNDKELSHYMITTSDISKTSSINYGFEATQ